MRSQIESTTTVFPAIEQSEASEQYDFETHLKDGIAAAQAGERETARTLLALAADINPHSEDVWMWLASISEYPEELLAFLNNVLQINPDNGRAAEWQAATRSLLAKTLVQRGIEAFNNSSIDQAAAFFEQAVANDANCEMAWFWLAGIATDNAVKRGHLERVVEINAHNFEALHALEKLDSAAVAEALEAAKKAALSGEHTKAIAMVDEVLENHLENADAWLLRSHFSIDIKEKLTSLERVLAIDPENAAAKASYEFLSSSMSVEEPATGEEPAPEPVTEAYVEEVVPESEPEMHEEPDAPAEDNEFEDNEFSCVSPEPEGAESETHMAETETDSFETDSFSEPVNDAFEGYSVYEPVTEIMAVEPEAADEHFEEVIDYGEPAVDLAHEGPVYVDHDGSDDVEHEVSVDHLHEEASVDMTHEGSVDLPEGKPACPYCYSLANAGGFECGSCRALLTLSDIEALLSNPNANADAIREGVNAMEAEWDQSELSVEQFTKLAVGHFNLGNLDQGLKYLQEAARLDPNNVILAGNVNTVAIRLDEMSRRTDPYDNVPKGKSILVIDDSPTVRKLISGKLEKSGHTVVCAADGVEGLERLAEQLPDLVLLDIGMPRMDGYEVCRNIRANEVAKDLPVVMISGKDGFFDKVRGKMAGATGYVTKPFGPETLMKALETYLVGEPLSNRSDPDNTDAAAPVTHELSLNA